MELLDFFLVSSALFFIGLDNQLQPHKRFEAYQFPDMANSEDGELSKNTIEHRRFLLSFRGVGTDLLPILNYAPHKDEDIPLPARIPVTAAATMPLESPAPSPAA